ncbi:hypothetical protein G210_4582, partial [Candida maltosa Xu316]
SPANGSESAPASESTPATGSESAPVSSGVESTAVTSVPTGGVTSTYKTCWPYVSTGTHGKLHTRTHCTKVTGVVSETSSDYTSVPTGSTESSVITSVPTGGLTSTYKTCWPYISTGTHIVTSYVTETAHSTSVVTVTHCSAGGCDTQTTKTGVVVVTITTTDVETTYTTYCPLTTTYALYGVAKVADVTGNVRREVTDLTDLVTDSYATEYSVSTLVAASNDTSSISIYEGSGSSIVPRIGIFAAILSGLLFLL